MLEPNEENIELSSPTGGQEAEPMRKFLVIRFSSIGDIVLTTPVVRCLKKQVPGAIIHYLIKPQFKMVMVPNPYIDKFHVL